MVDNVLAWVGDEILAWFHAGFRRQQPAVAAFGRFTGRAFDTV